MAKKKKSKNEFDLEVEGSVTDLGNLQHKVLTNIVERKFDDAVVALKDYQNKKKYSPGYAVRADRLFIHAEELVAAIKAKRNFPNLSSLTQAKQEELTLKVKEHWEDLKVSLRRLRTIEKDLEVEDAKSSLWVIRAIIFATMVLLSVFIVHEAFISMGVPAKVIFNDIMNFIWSFL